MAGGAARGARGARGSDAVGRGRSVRERAGRPRVVLRPAGAGATQPERHVSLDAVRAFKLVTLAEVDAIVTVVRRLLPGLTDRDGVDLIAAAAAMSGAFWQMATPRA